MHTHNPGSRRVYRAFLKNGSSGSSDDRLLAASVHKRDRPVLAVSSAMHKLVALLVLWSTLSGATLLLGSYWINVAERAIIENQFQSQLNAVRAAIARLNATASEANSAAAMQAWRRMEAQYDIDIISIPALPAGRPTVIQWQNVGRERQLRALIAVEPDTTDVAGQIAWYQVTRKIQSPSLPRIWWWCGMAISLLGSFLICAQGAWEIKALRRQQVLLEPWLQAVRTNPQAPLHLEELVMEHPLSSQLKQIANTVNEQIQRLTSANHRSALVLQNLAEGVLAVDSQSQILLANRAMQIHLDFGDNHYLYRPMLEVVRTPQVNDLVEQVLSTGTPSEDIIVAGNRSLRVVSHPLPISEGQVGVLITTRDETLIKRIDAVRKDFIANASHELKTPLAAIRAYAETLQMGALDDREVSERFVGNIISQADRIDALIQGMLQLSRVESGFAINNDLFVVQHALEPCLAAARATSSHKSIQVSASLPVEPVRLRCDRGGFQTIASNLLSNAVRYTPENGHVSVRLTTDGNAIVLQIEDTGVGISQEDLARIFERFYRADKHRSSDTGGTGLGLSIVKHLTNALGGTITVRSALHKGSCFEVRLPGLKTE
ncbi:MAG: PAS domain-containing protein [Planctomycetales bacterium]|nr:PAS domain-containing protein [Planctomycetales bacterium]